MRANILREKQSKELRVEGGLLHTFPSLPIFTEEKTKQREMVIVSHPEMAHKETFSSVHVFFRSVLRHISTAYIYAGPGVDVVRTIKCPSN